jgi:hypothetical protein
MARTRCRWCGRGFDRRDGPGRPQQYCRRSCRQRDYEARRRSAEIGLDESQLVVARAELDRLYDHLWMLECAITDVESDLDARATIADHRQAIGWLLAAAKELVALRR